MSITHILACGKEKEPLVQALASLYLVILPLVMGAAVVEGLWLSRTRAEAYDWKSWACSLADLAGRRLLAFIP